MEKPRKLILGRTEKFSDVGPTITNGFLEVHGADDKKKYQGRQM